MIRTVQGSPGIHPVNRLKLDPLVLHSSAPLLNQRGVRLSVQLGIVHPHVRHADPATLLLLWTIFMETTMELSTTAYNCYHRRPGNPY